MALHSIEQSWDHESPDIPIFHPTWKEFNFFGEYLTNTLEKKYEAHKKGICVIRPPPEWKHPAYFKEQFLKTKFLENYLIKSPVLQSLKPRKSGNCNIAGWYKLEHTEMNPEKFKILSKSKFDIPQMPWDNIEFLGFQKAYGSDDDQSFFDPSDPLWNLNALINPADNILAWMTKDYGSSHNIKGLHDALSYFGSPYTVFPWHTEEHDLYASLYLHWGANKCWACVPPQYAEQLQDFLKKKADKNDVCKSNAYLRHKSEFVFPQVIRNENIPCRVYNQKEGEFVIVFPGAAHCGFNYGANVGESTNFATKRWVPYGKFARQCKCIGRNFIILNLDCIIQRMETKSYQNWALGNEYGKHPERLSLPVQLALKPTKVQIKMNTRNLLNKFDEIENNFQYVEEDAKKEENAKLLAKEEFSKRYGSAEQQHTENEIFSEDSPRRTDLNLKSEDLKDLKFKVENEITRCQTKKIQDIKQMEFTVGKYVTEIMKHGFTEQYLRETTRTNNQSKNSRKSPLVKSMKKDDIQTIQKLAIDYYSTSSSELRKKGKKDTRQPNKKNKKKIYLESIAEEIRNSILNSLLNCRGLVVKMLMTIKKLKLF